MKTPTIKIDSFTMDTGETVFSLWFWLDGKCEHIDYYDSRFEAEWAGEKVLRIAALQREYIRNAI